MQYRPQGAQKQAWTLLHQVTTLDLCCLCSALHTTSTSQQVQVANLVCVANVVFTLPMVKEGLILPAQQLHNTIFTQFIVEAATMYLARLKGGTAADTSRKCTIC
jgi:hypothetical protein